MGECGLFPLASVVGFDEASFLYTVSRHAGRGLYAGHNTVASLRYCVLVVKRMASCSLLLHLPGRSNSVPAQGDVIASSKEPPGSSNLKRTFERAWTRSSEILVCETAPVTYRIPIVRNLLAYVSLPVDTCSSASYVLRHCYALFI